MTTAVGLEERLRIALAHRDPREVRMFGGTSFLIDGRLVVAARNDGDLLVRIDPAQREHLLGRPGAAGALMGDGRAMGSGWISVTPDGVVGEALDWWLASALEYHASQATR